MQIHWREQQQQVLNALGITAYQLKQGTESHSGEQAHPPFCYRLGPIYVESLSPIPVETPRWLRDLAIIWDTQPAAVKAPDCGALTVSYEQLTEQLDSAAGKRALWQQLQRADVV